MTPFESAVRGSLEGSRGDRSTSTPGPRANHRATPLSGTQLFASLLIASGLDVKVVQARLRHASAKTTLDTYGHLWPDRDDTSRAAVAAVYRLSRDDEAVGQHVE